MINWYIVNKRLLELERIPEEARSDEWEKEWNELVDTSTKIAGCIQRQKYEAKQVRKGQDQEAGEGDHVEVIHGHLDEEKAQLGGIREVVGEGSTDSVLSPHLAQEQV